AFTYTPAAQGNGTPYASFTFQVRDDGDPSGAIDQSPNTITINVTAVNDAPTFTKGPDQSILSDSGPHRVNAWATHIAAGRADEVGSQTVRFVITGNTTPGLFAVAPAVSPSGVLTYTPRAGATGVATISVRARDTGPGTGADVNTSAAQTFKITIRPKPAI